MFPPNAKLTTRGGIIANTTAHATTIGVYTFANLVINLSVFAFLPLACSTNSSIFETVDSPNSFVTLIVRAPFILIEPLIISSPAIVSLGRLSPVRDDVSILP